MNIFFVGQIVPEALLNARFESLNNLCNNAANVFYNALLTGLVQNGCGVTAISSVTKNIEENASEIEKSWDYDCLFKSFGAGKLKHIRHSAYTYKKMHEWYRKNKDGAALFNCLRISQSIAGILFCKLNKIKSVAVVTDVPGYRTFDRKSVSIKVRTADWLGRKLLNCYDGHVLLSEEMTKVIPMRGKPYVVIEGICSRQTAAPDGEKEEKFTVMYAGSLMHKYNISNLVQAIIDLNRNDVVLKLYGRGDMEEELTELSEKYECIQYCGSISNAQCLRAEKRAHLLVNPRSPKEEYTKYSFPSKNIEYMKSATPVLYTKLPSMPQEYYPYINIIEDESAQGIKEAIENILNTDYEVLTDKALYAKAFVEENKNCRIQAEKVKNIFMDLVKYARRL